MRKGKKVYLVDNFDNGIKEVRYHGKSTIEGKSLIKTRGSDYTDRVESNDLYESLDEAIKRFNILREERAQGAIEEAGYYRQQAKEIRKMKIPLYVWGD